MAARMAMFALWAAALLGGCSTEVEPPPAGQAEPPPPAPPGSIAVSTTVNGLPQGCDVLGGGGEPQVYVDGVGPYATQRADGLSPGLHQVSARCLACDRTVLAEASTAVEVVAGKVAAAQLVLAGPVATGSLTVRWDASGCRDARAWVILRGGATCRDVDVACATGEVALPNVQPGTYSVHVGCGDSQYYGTLAYLFCGCSGAVSGVVVPGGPVAPGAVVAGPVTLQCGCLFQLPL